MNAEMLHEFVRDIATKSASPEPNVIAEEVLQALPKKNINAALLIALRHYVFTVVKNMRHVAIHGENQPPHGSTSSQSEKWKSAASVLDQRLPTADGWKFVRDCTAVDFLATAQRRRVHAAGYIAQAERFEKLAARMNEAGAETAADLGEEVVAELLS